MTRGLGDLYDLLIRPLEGRIGRASEGLVIVADGMLAGIPFAGLYDRARGRHLVQERPVRLAATLAGHADPVSSPPSRAVLVADPAFDRAGYPGFAPLPGAVAEVAAIGSLYDSASALTGTAADRSSVLAAAAGAELLHFAGHAVLDDARPERSFLLLAGRGSAGRLTAEELETVDLRGVRLVVLSACETARAPDGRSGGLSGLSAALLGAGAKGVTGSLWRVDDQLTRALMVEFHRAYLATGDAAAALRRAQLALLASPDPRLRSPAAWAGFTHMVR